jgi:hypothetical protein
LEGTKELNHLFSAARIAARWLNQWKQEHWEVLEVTLPKSKLRLDSSSSSLEEYNEKATYRCRDLIVFLSLFNDRSASEAKEILARMECARLLFTFQPSNKSCSLDEIRDQLFARGFTYVHIQAPRLFSKDHLVFAMRPSASLKRSITLSQKRERQNWVAVTGNGN